MTREQFDAIMPYISSDLIDMIARKKVLLRMKHLSDYTHPSFTHLLSRKTPKYGSTALICFIHYLNRKKKTEV